MSLGQLTDRSAVIRAIEEYDRLGQSGFLSKYRFGPSRNYVLIWNGRRYDSKAVAGAAHGFQFPEEGPLHADKFTGGEVTVRRRLEALGFTVSKLSEVEKEPNSSKGNENHRNPPWSRDELILALDAYVRWNGNPPGKTSQDIADLSRVMNNLHRVLGTTRTETLRNANGVYMKLMNYRRFDPRYRDSGRRGLVRGNKLEESVWNEFSGDPLRLEQVARVIQEEIEIAISHGKSEERDADLFDGEEAVEGSLLTVAHKRRERSRKIVEQKKAWAISKLGRLACEVCEFDFAARYGSRGKDFIECHHTTPVASLGNGTPTKLGDLALVCANCHRMIHTRRPWLTVDELRKFLR